MIVLAVLLSFIFTESNCRRIVEKLLFKTQSGSSLAHLVEENTDVRKEQNAIF
jgi:hypothetical protein